MNRLSVFTILFFLLLNACSDSEQGVGVAYLSVYMHDAPAGYDEVLIHVMQVSAIGTDDKNEIVLGKPDRIINILELINGNRELLGRAEVEPGRYSRLKLLLGTDHSLIVDGVTHELPLAGGNSVEIPFDATLGENSEYVVNLDFDAARSVVQKGSHYELIPWIRAYKEASTVSLTGKVLADGPGALITSRRGGSMWTSTRTEKGTGEFRMMGLESGVYQIDITPLSGNYPTVTQSNVILTEEGETVSLGTYVPGASNLFLVGDYWSRRRLHEGVELLQHHYSNLDGYPRYLSILAVDTKSPETNIRFTSTYLLGGNPHRLSVSEYGERSNALAATNAGFGHGGIDFYNSGILKIEGEIIPFFDDEPNNTRFVGSSAVGIDAEGQWHFRERPGENWDDEWPEVEHALAGGHMLISDGAIKGNILRNEFSTTTERDHMNRQHPRTAICRTSEEVIALFAIDGRHSDQAIGMSLLELANFMLDHGCVDAINLDGGGSTTMWSREHGVVNHPTDNGQFDNEGERILRTAIIVRGGG